MRKKQIAKLVEEVVDADYEYDYNVYEKILKEMLLTMWRDPDNLEIGENISDLPEVKIIFDGYGDLEDEDENGEYRYTEGGNTNMESYAIFIHKDALSEGFEFPEHEMTPWALIHRTEEEVCIHAWYDVQNDEWTINGLYETMEHTMSDRLVMNILEELYDRYFASWENPVFEKNEDGSAAWPFPLITKKVK